MLVHGNSLNKCRNDSVSHGVLGQASEVGQACLWLSSDAASYVSGAILPVDGGWLAAGVPLDLAAVASAK